MIAGAVIKAALSRVPVPVWSAGAAVLLMAIPLGVQTVRLGEARSEIVRLSDRVEDLSADLATCQTNTATLEASISEQNAAVEEMARRASERIAESEAAAAQARADAQAAQARIADFLNRPIQGETTCDRVQDVDAAVMADLRGRER